MICTVVVIDEPVELVKVSTVRAKSWLPRVGHGNFAGDGQAGGRAAAENAGFARCWPCCTWPPSG